MLYNFSRDIDTNEYLASIGNDDIAKRYEVLHVSSEPLYTERYVRWYERSVTQ